MDIKRAKFLISGLVQGVGFRYFAYRTALSLGLQGFAENRYDGSVEIIAEGHSEKIDEFKSRLKEGPGRARVDNILAEYCSPTGEFSGFTIR